MASPDTSISNLRPAGPLLVYLDLNKWIDLAHAKTGTEKGGAFESVLTSAMRLAAEGRVIFPLSFAHFMEVAKIGKEAQRRTLAGLMVELSQGWFLSSASALLMGELRRAIALRFDRPFAETGRMALTRSMKTVFGDPKQIEAIGDFDETLFSSPRVLEEFLSTARVGTHFLDNWRTFADQHEAGRALRWDTSKEVRKRAYCVMVTLGIQPRLAEVFSEFGLSIAVLEELGPDGCVALLEQVPTLDVEINLNVERNEHRDRRIDPNDEVDLGFLSLAVPYCHAVVTEKFWASLVRRLNLDQKYGSVIGTDLNDTMRALGV